MNYRHAYHAGNVGDVLKHIVLTRVLAHLRLKEAPFFALDTHAGAGAYDLTGAEAQATGEWRAGLGVLLGASRPAGLAPIIADYLAAIDVSEGGGPRRYPGSPMLIARALRERDRAVFAEAHAPTTAQLRRTFAGERRIEVVDGDGWAEIDRRLPPRERRGLVLIDPPFEASTDYVALSQALARGHRRFATGTYLLWHPIKGTTDMRGLDRALVALAIPKTLALRLTLREPNHPKRFDGSGLIVVNPPHTLAAEMRLLLPWLAALFATGPGGGGDVSWLVPETGA